MPTVAVPPGKLLGCGLYTVREASRLTGLAYARVREWFRRQSQRDIAPVGRDVAISFHDLIDVYVVGNLRDCGISMASIRKVHDRMQLDLGERHPFCHRELLLDGRRVFLEYGDDRLIDVLRKQGVFERIIRPFLKKIDYDELTQMAQRWRIDKGIVVDPRICFGAPIVESVGIPSSILAAALRANNGNLELVASWHGVKKADIIAASEFERELAA